jgi:hypothetical protein
MTFSPLLARWDIVATAQRALRNGGASLRNVPGLVKRVIREEAWREYEIPSGEVVRFETFEAFVMSPWGFDATLAMVKHICDEDLEALDLIDRELARPKKRKRDKTSPVSLLPESESQGALFQDHEGNEETLYNVKDIPKTLAPTGNSRDRALRRLRQGNRDVHARVLAGELSPRQGMIAAGFLHPPTPLAMLHRYWRKATVEERRRFLADVAEEGGL